MIPLFLDIFVRYTALFTVGLGAECVPRGNELLLFRANNSRERIEMRAGQSPGTKWETVRSEFD